MQRGRRSRACSSSAPAARTRSSTSRTGSSAGSPSSSLNYDPPSRNTYPDFRLVASTVGFELKGLEFPGRIADFDCNSQVSTGLHNGRTIYYVFGRYPKSKENTYPVLDLVICHGNFLNARHDYIHENKSFRGFGSYGDILVRDRKMYVAPTPFGLLDGIDRQVTLILLADETGR